MSAITVDELLKAYDDAVAASAANIQGGFTTLELRQATGWSDHRARTFVRTLLSADAIGRGQREIEDISGKRVRVPVYFIKRETNVDSGRSGRADRRRPAKGLRRGK